MTTRGALLAELARAQPASLVAFDVLQVAGRDVTGLPWRSRRRLLEEVAGHWHPPLQLSPVTAEPVEAEEWFTEWRPPASRASW